MIDLSQEVIIELYLKAFLIGAFHGVLYDVIRFIKMLCGVRYYTAESRPYPTCKRVFIYILSFAFDVAFWLCLGISSVLLFYNVSGGVFRGSVYPCMLSGLALYYFSIGRVTLALGQWLIGVMERCLSFVKRLICRCLSFLKRLLAVPINAFCRAIIYIYHLTIGKIVVKIKGKIIASRERRNAKECPASGVGEEEQNEEDSERPYKKYGRISF